MERLGPLSGPTVGAVFMLAALVLAFDRLREHGVLSVLKACGSLLATNVLPLLLVATVLCCLFVCLPLLLLFVFVRSCWDCCRKEDSSAHEEDDDELPLLARPWRTRGCVRCRWHVDQCSRPIACDCNRRGDNWESWDGCREQVKAQKWIGCLLRGRESNRCEACSERCCICGCGPHAKLGCIRGEEWWTKDGGIEFPSPWVIPKDEKYHGLFFSKDIIYPWYWKGASWYVYEGAHYICRRCLLKERVDTCIYGKCSGNDRCLSATCFRCAIFAIQDLHRSGAIRTASAKRRAKSKTGRARKTTAH